MIKNPIKILQNQLETEIIKIQHISEQYSAVNRYTFS